MHKNLRAEMARNGVTMENVSKLLGVRLATVSDKVNGKYRFYYDEAHTIKHHFFPECSIEYLFATEKVQSEEVERNVATAQS
ncbi:helix-turn-helix domain-containing protein [Aureibacillus halotolerans]|uniref:DNA-binding protein n=1 Tax=Aureibacillus halotolerans TaxID=1508390 RepID=A0A4R6U362_9BACI|nr:helix-turn-helix transcriptional regulator [Aureibacillus halotolerans]TDQ39193.1 hypothetical protein EV213_108145 [Aureibacillus halotolerans]